MWMGIWVHPYTVKPLQVGVDFGKIGVGLSPSDVAMSWLRLQTPVDCIPHQYYMYTKCFSTLCTYTLIPVQVGDVVSWLNVSTSILYLYKVFEYLHLHMLWMGIVWVPSYTGICHVGSGLINSFVQNLIPTLDTTSSFVICLTLTPILPKS